MIRKKNKRENTYISSIVLQNFKILKIILNEMFKENRKKKKTSINL